MKKNKNQLNKLYEKEIEDLKGDLRLAELREQILINKIKKLIEEKKCESCSN